MNWSARKQKRKSQNVLSPVKLGEDLLGVSSPFNSYLKSLLSNLWTGFLLIQNSIDGKIILI